VLFTFARLRKWVEAMEYFGALPGTPLVECLKAVRRADIFVGVIGTRYGSKDKVGVSITQREYEEAYRHNKTVLAYLLDEENHPVLPKFVDTGEDAVRLAEFKRLLRDRHICAQFSSPQDLALRIGVDLVYHLDLYSDGQTADHTREFLTEMPTLLSKAGYDLGMRAHIIDLSGILELKGGNQLEIRDSIIEEIVVAGHLAVNVSRGNYDILQPILTFDLGLWRLFVNMVRHYGVNSESLAEFIDQCKEPMHFRLLARLAGDLALGSCAEPICRWLVEGAALDRRFTELGAALLRCPI
jgi:hypothetical protein